METVRVRLTKKLAEMIDGIDLSKRVVGQTFQLRPDQARLLVLEGWAVALDAAAQFAEPGAAVPPDKSIRFSTV
jgi:hypothetical protein